MIKKHVLPNKVRIMYEQIPYVRSVTTGIWVGAGSRYEDEAENGISHFIEHMVFKGTKKRSAKEIAEVIDNVGGQLNAFTGQEYTCYYAKTLDTHIDLSVDLLADMFFNSKFLAKNMETERKVIIEEIGMSEDQPDECAMSLLIASAWSGSSLGRPIIGTRESLANITKDSIRSYMDANYRPDNTIISVAGNFDEAAMIALVEKSFGWWKPSAPSGPTLAAPAFISGFNHKPKETEQVHMIMGFKGISAQDDDTFVLNAVNSVLGGGMSSRLFQKIREQYGLVYSIYSFPLPYLGTGLFTVYAGMSAEYLTKVVTLVKGELDRLISESITDDELSKAKEQMKGNFILAQESTSGRMSAIGKSELLLGRTNSVDEILAKIDAVTPERVRKVIPQVMDFGNLSFAAVGKITQAQQDNVRKTLGI